jgi:outer membrane protein
MKKIIFVFFIIIVNFHLSTAQKNSEKVYTLQECVEIGLSQNLDVIRAKAYIEPSQANLKAAFGSYLPNIQFSMGYNRQLNAQGGQTVNVGGQVIKVGETSPNSYNMGLNAGLNLFDGFNREANYKAADLNYQGSLLSFEQAKILLKINIYRRFFDYASKKQIMQTRKENLEAGKKDLESIKAKYEVGQLPISVVYSKEAELGSLELDLSKAENDLNISRANLLSLMGLNPTQKSDFSTTDFNLNITNKDIENFRNKIGDFESNINEALKSRYDYQAQIKNVQSMQNRVLSAKASYYPQLQIGTGWSWSNTAFQDFSDKGRSYVGLNLSVPIFTGFATNANVQQSEYNYKIQEIQKASLELSIKTEVESALLNLDAAEKQIDIAEKSLFSAEMNYKILKERFDLGSANILELTQANTQYLNAKINQINSIFYYLLAQKEVEYSIGRLN